MLNRVITAALGAPAIAIAIGVLVLDQVAPVPPAAPPPPAAHYEIHAALVFTDGRTDTGTYQSCGVYWVEGSATEMERVCEANRFATRAEAEAALDLARVSFEQEQPPGLASVDFTVEEVQP